MSSSRRSPSFRGALLLAVVAALLVSIASPVPGSAQNVQERDGWINGDLLVGDWVRVGGNNPRNNGMRIRVVADAEGVRAILTAMPPTSSRAFRVGQILWTDFDGRGTLSVRGSDGGYYSSSFTITEGAETTRDYASRLEIDIDHNGRGNDQTWERAGASIDGDWVLVDSHDPELSNDFKGLQVRVEGDRATVSYVTAAASSRYRTGEEFWQGIEGKPLEDEFDHGSGTLEYRESGTRSWRDDPFELTRDYLLLVGTPGESQMWVRPEEAEEFMAIDERGEPLVDLPTEPADDPDAAGRDLDRSGEERTVDVPEGLPPPLPEPEEKAACLATSLRHDEIDVDWGWGITAPKPSSVLPVSALVHWPRAEREEYEIAVALPRFGGASRNDEMIVDADRSIVADLDDHASFVWRDNDGGRPWRHEPNLETDDLASRIASYRDDGYRFRPIDIEGYSSPDGNRFTAVWVRNLEGVEWQAEFDLTSSEYGSLYRQYRDDGYRLTDVEIYSTPQGLRHAGIWIKSCDNSNWRQYRNLTKEQFEDRDRELGARLFKVIDFESYRSSQGQLYAAIWEKVPNRRWVADPDLDLKSFLNRHHDLSDAGFRLIDYESYETSNGPRYAGVWAENDPRIRYEAKAALDNLITSYRQANDLTGMSVVIIEDGDVVYRRGFGWADSLAGKRAHSQTVYLTASVSKVIGATLAAKLEERMVGGLDLTATTITYLGEPAAEYLDMEFDCSSPITRFLWRCRRLPDDHTHTVEQLLSKTGCIHHYQDTNSQTPDRSRFYKWRVRALVQIWDAGLLPNCVPGRHYRYSTHSFTYVGAVLEAVTGKPIARLLQDEIAQPLGLHSIRAMHTRGGLLANYDRSTAYTLSNTSTTNTGALVTQPGPNNRSIATNYEDNTSWKVLGGGIESNALDLAWFGWKLLDGEIVSEETLDRMWMPDADQEDYNSVAPNPVRQGTIPGGVSGIGLAWEFGIDTRSRWLRHAGDGTGAGSYIKIWRDRDVVIAMLSNRRWHVNQSRNRLLDNLAQVVMDATRP